jgi:MFS family permease
VAQDFGFGRDYWLYYGGETVSRLGDMFGSMAMVWVIMQRTGSALAVARGLLFRLLPPLLLGPVAGLVIDRFPRRRVMVAGNLANATVSLYVAWIIASGRFQVWQAYLWLFSAAVIDPFYIPSSRALLPSIVPGPRFQRANAFALSTSNVLGLFGTALAGLAIKRFGEASAVTFDAASFLVAAACLGLAREGYKGLGPAARRGRGLGRAARDVREGLAFVVRHPVLRVLVLAFAVVNAVNASGSVAMPLFVTRGLGSDISAFGVLASLASLGGLLGSMLVTFRGPDRRPGLTIGLAVAFCGLASLARGLAPSLWLAAAFGFLVGLPGAFMSVASEVIYKDVVPEEARGRVYSWRYVLSTSVSPLAVAASGRLVDGWGPRAVLAGSGLLVVLAGLVALGSRSVRDFGREASQTQPAAAQLPAGWT